MFLLEPLRDAGPQVESKAMSSCVALTHQLSKTMRFSCLSDLVFTHTQKGEPVNSCHFPLRTLNDYFMIRMGSALVHLLLINGPTENQQVSVCGETDGIQTSQLKTCSHSNLQAGIRPASTDPHHITVTSIKATAHIQNIDTYNVSVSQHQMILQILFILIENMNITIK